MLLASYTQNLDPLGNRLISTLFAALPVVTLFWLLVPRRWLAPKAGAGGAVAALLIAIFVYGMPAPMAIMSFVHGAGFGLLPVGWTIFNAMLLYNITVETGQFTIVRRSVSGLSGDARIQAILIGFCFGAFMEGAAGAGSPQPELGPRPVSGAVAGSRSRRVSARTSPAGGRPRRCRLRDVCACC